MKVRSVGRSIGKLASKVFAAAIAVVIAATAFGALVPASPAHAEGTVGKRWANVECNRDYLTVSVDMWATQPQSFSNIALTGDLGQLVAFRIHVFHSMSPSGPWGFADYNGDWLRFSAGSNGASDAFMEKPSYLNLRTGQYQLPDRVYLLASGYYKVAVEYYWYAARSVGYGYVYEWAPLYKDTYTTEFFATFKPYCVH